jgi:hypothetical protein
MEKAEEVNFENTQEAQAMGNALRILVRMIAGGYDFGWF